MDKLKNTSFRFFEDSTTASTLTERMWSYESKQIVNVDPNNESQKNITYYKKNSSGLAKGDIAGIAFLAQQLQNKRHNFKFIISLIYEPLKIFIYFK